MITKSNSFFRVMYSPSGDGNLSQMSTVFLRIFGQLEMSRMHIYKCGICNI